MHPFVARRGRAGCRRLTSVVATRVMSARMVAATMTVTTMVVMLARRYVVMMVPAAAPVSRSGRIEGWSIARVDGRAAVMWLGAG